VTEPLADDLDGDTGGDEQRRVRVPQVVEANTGEQAAPHDAVEELRDRFGVEDPGRGLVRSQLDSECEWRW
jgi:hypothetical protein